VSLKEVIALFWSLARRIQLGVLVLGAELLSNWNMAVFCEIDEGSAPSPDRRGDPR